MSVPRFAALLFAFAACAAQATPQRVVLLVDEVEAIRNFPLVVAPTSDADYYESAGVATVWADLTTPEGTKRRLGVLFPTSTVVMKRATVQARPEVARHLARAFVRTLTYIHAHSAEEIAALVPVEVRGRDQAAYLRTLREAMPMFAGDGRMPDDGAPREAQWLATFKPALATAKVELSYTNEFAKRAVVAPH
ncbi:MAG: hypothetical protein KGN16_22695 [Burkholderiales bacterium]|nr:hypothetical protein [Burkholderiales bacterium]